MSLCLSFLKPFEWPEEDHSHIQGRAEYDVCLMYKTCNANYIYVYVGDIVLYELYELQVRRKDYWWNFEAIVQSGDMHRNEKCRIPNPPVEFPWEWEPV